MVSVYKPNELSYDSFIETFGNVGKSRHDKKELNSKSGLLRKIPRISITDEEETNEKKDEEHDDFMNNNVKGKNRINGPLSPQSPTFEPCRLQAEKMPHSSRSKHKHFRKISFDTLSSLGGAVQAAVSPRRNKTSSSAIDSSERSPLNKRKMERKNSWLSSISPSFVRRLRTEATYSSGEEGDSLSDRGSDREVESSSYTNVLPIPASEFNTATHKGYLHRRIKKKRWEKYWCVLQDTMLYLFNSPQSEKTSDAVSIRGCDVIADITNINRTRFGFRIRKQGLPTLHLSSDDHREFLLWVGALEKAKGSFSRSSKKSRSFSVESSPSSPVKHQDFSMKRHNRSSLPIIPVNDYTCPPEFDSLEEQADYGELKMQKKKLLREIEAQQQHIMEEQKLLNKLPSISEQDGCRFPISCQGLSRQEVLDKYERERSEEELKRTKLITVLNCRRNSCHLKLVQMSKDQSPNDKEKSRSNRAKVFTMQKKLKGMQESLDGIEKEIEKEEEKKQVNLERLEKKRDMELLLVEQHHVIDVLRINHSRETSPCANRRSFHDVAMTSSTDHLSKASDYLARSSVSSPTNATGKFDSPTYRSTRSLDLPECSCFSSPLLNRSNSNPFDWESPLIGVQLSDNDFSSNERKSHNVNSSNKLDSISSSKPASPSSLEEMVRQTEHSTGLKRTNISNASKSPDSFQNEVDSSILAKIEDFELFAKLKLEEATGETTKL